MDAYMSDTYLYLQLNIHKHTHIYPLGRDTLFQKSRVRKRYIMNQNGKNENITLMIIII